MTSGTSPQLSPPSLWPHGAPHRVMLGVSAPDEQCNPAPRAQRCPGHRRVSLGVWFPRGNHRSSVNPEDPHNLLEGFSKDPFASSFTQTPMFMGVGKGPTPKDHLSLSTPFWLRVLKAPETISGPGTCSRSLPSLPSLLRGPQAQGQRSKAP